MPRNVTITFADGTSHVYQNVPDNATPEQVTARAQGEFQGKEIASLDGGKKAAPAKPQPAKPGLPDNYSLTDLVRNKITMGLTDKVRPLIEAGFDWAQGKSGFGDSYQAHQAHVDQQREQYKKDHPALDWATLPANFMGGAGSAAKMTLGALAKAGAAGGFAAGAGQSRGSAGQQAAQTALSTGVGAIAAPVLASAAPVVVGAGQRVISKVAARAAGRASVAAPSRSGQILLKTLAEQGQTPAQASQAMMDAQANGVPMALMDTGDEARGLASGLSRKPGPTRTLIRDVAIPRQAAQTERVQGAMARDLGPTTNVRAQSEQLMSGASAKASPLYDQAYSNGGAAVFHGQTADLLKRPSMQKALSNAVRIAAEEGRDPKALGLTIGKDGLLVKVDKPTWQTWDYIKRGMDDVVESYRDKTTGRLNLDTEGRAVNNTLRDFLGRIDKVNPDYAAARAAYAGPAKMTTALNKGAKIGTKDADAIWAETRDLSPAELDQYRLGARTALSKLMEGRTDSADKAHALLGTPKKRQALAQLFGGEAKFDRFITTLQQEGQTSATHARVAMGSQTAANLADDANASGIAGVAGNAVVRAVKGHGIVSNGIATIGDLLKYGSGKAGERTVAELAAGLSETDPKALAAAFKAANRAAAAKRAGAKSAAAVRNIGAVAGSRQAGTLASLFAPNQ